MIEYLSGLQPVHCGTYRATANYHREHHGHTPRSAPLPPPLPGDPRGGGLGEGLAEATSEVPVLDADGAHEVVVPVATDRDYIPATMRRYSSPTRPGQLLVRHHELPLRRLFAGPRGVLGGLGESMPPASTRARRAMMVEALRTGCLRGRWGVGGVAGADIGA